MRGSLLQHHREIDRLLGQTRRIAVLGIKPEDRAPAPAYAIPAYLHRVGYDIVPVPVYYPDIADVFGKPIYRSVSGIPGRVDVVDVFRKHEDLEPHLEDLIKARPHAVWLQTGIRHDAFAERLLDAGIDVVQDQCLMVEHRRWRSGA